MESWTTWAEAEVGLDLTVGDVGWEACTCGFEWPSWRQLRRTVACVTCYGGASLLLFTQSKFDLHNTRAM
jgi:hypothetical protein